MEGLMPAQDNIEASSASMAAMRGAYRGDMRRMARSGKPVVHSRANPPAYDGRFAAPLMPGNQQHDAIAGANRPLERMIDRRPGTVEVVTVKVQCPVRADRPGSKPLVPAAVERRRFKRLARRRHWRKRAWRRDATARDPRFPRRYYDRWRGGRDGLNRNLARQRPERRGDPAPQFGLFSGELAHAPPRPWATGSSRARWPTCRPLSLRPLRPRPRRCRSDWRP